MAPHVKSKRTTLKQKYKAQKKVRQHHRDVRRANRHKPEIRKIKKKDPGIPNLWPYKQQLLESMERKRQADDEAKKALASARKAALQAAREAGIDPSVAQVVADARLRNREFDAREGLNDNDGDTGAGPAPRDDANAPADSSKRAFMREFKKVMESSDVILEVLDARDPLGCRCFQAERAVVASSGGSKRIVLVLNKVDLVPKEVVDKWLAYLRNDFPTVAFRASVQEGRGKGQANMSAVGASTVNTSECLGAGNLLSLLKNYSRSKNMKTSIAVGVIGYPNVGKSSLINSLKRARVVSAGATPGVTRNAQEIHLDKNIRLIDCPGIVFSNNQADALVLRNCIKVENLLDPIAPIETIINRVGHEPLMVAYSVPAFKTVTEFLACVSSLRGKVRRGGAFDVEAAARVVLQDWNNGNIPFYTLPPKGPSNAHLSAAVVRQWGDEFNMQAVTSQEEAQLSSLPMSAKQKASFAAAEAVAIETLQDNLMTDGPNGDEVPQLVKADDKADEQQTYHVAALQ